MSDEMPKDIAAELRVRAAMEQVEDSVFERAAADIERLRKERDEARREVCNLLWQKWNGSETEIANQRGWDCYKEDPR